MKSTLKELASSGSIAAIMSPASCRLHDSRQDAGLMILSFARFSRERKETVVVCCNFTPVVRANFRLGVPKQGHYQEIFNSDSSFYAGTNVGNGEGINSELIEWNGRPDSISFNVPPLGVVMFKHHDH